jgi:hypothetical protein
MKKRTKLWVDPCYAPARRVLKRLKIDIHSVDNGVALPSTFHDQVHTQAYYDMINEAAKGWKTKEQATKGLQDIAESLMKQSGKLK